MLGMPPRPARSATTTAAGVVGIVISALWALFGLLLLIAAAIVDEATEEVDDDEAFTGFNELGDAAATVLAIGGILLLACAAWSIVSSSQLIRRRRWARPATIITFSVWTGLSVIFVVVSLADGSSDGDRGASFQDEFDEGSDDPGAAGAIMWAVNAAACATVIVLAAQRSVGDDLAGAEVGDRAPGVAWSYAAPPPGYAAPAFRGAPPPGYGAPGGGPGYGGPPPPGPGAYPPTAPPPPPPPPPQDPFAPPGSPG